MDASAASFLSLLVLIFIISLAAEAGPAPQGRDVKAMTALFGSRLSSLLMAVPPPPSEGSAEAPAAPAAGGSRFLADDLRRHAKMRRRGGKWTALGGRGCFGLKMDRIGAVSRLGC
ncbi:C-type natriuretic peptide 2 [Syngnathoides biaculeatus]|uniref:C-type natriuretic peptide 2 n=1 Tax=Syngnathoides biaculeatus TaxID=300417 RepID=UPI002ADD6250|nr:C-type natriuretic peptide 2 [Syngnathoides biaculeatus]